MKGLMSDVQVCFGRVGATGCVAQTEPEKRADYLALHPQNTHTLQKHTTAAHTHTHTHTHTYLQTHTHTHTHTSTNSNKNTSLITAHILQNMYESMCVKLIVYLIVTQRSISAPWTVHQWPPQSQSLWHKSTN